MMTRPFAMIALSLLAACASSPNKELKSARDERAAHFVDNVRAQQDLADKQRNARSTTMGTLIADNERVSLANSAVVRERHAFDAEVTDRLARIDARAKWLRDESRGKHVTPLWKAFDDSRAHAKAHIDALWTHSNDAFPDAKADVNARLDALDANLEAIRVKVAR